MPYYTICRILFIFLYILFELFAIIFSLVLSFLRELNDYIQRNTGVTRVQRNFSDRCKRDVIFVKSRVCQRVKVKLAAH